MGSCLPDERALAWLVLSLEKLGKMGCVELSAVPAAAAVVEPAAVPAAAAVKAIASPAAPARARNRAVFMISLLPYVWVRFGTLAAIIVKHNVSSRLD
jgi:hypothetical protein